MFSATMSMSTDVNTKKITKRGGHKDTTALYCLYNIYLYVLILVPNLSKLTIINIASHNYGKPGFGQQFSVFVQNLTSAVRKAFNYRTTDNRVHGNYRIFCQ